MVVRVCQQHSLSLDPTGEWSLLGLLPTFSVRKVPWNSSTLGSNWWVTDPWDERDIQLDEWLNFFGKCRYIYQSVGILWLMVGSIFFTGYRLSRLLDIGATWHHNLVDENWMLDLHFKKTWNYQKLLLILAKGHFGLIGELFASRHCGLCSTFSELSCSKSIWLFTYLQSFKIRRLVPETSKKTHVKQLNGSLATSKVACEFRLVALNFARHFDQKFWQRDPWIDQQKKHPPGGIKKKTDPTFKKHRGSLGRVIR